jgi:hypothetical protein
MSQKSGTPKSSSERIVKDICRDARLYGASAGVCEDRPLYWVQNGSLSGAPSHRKPRFRVLLTNPRRRGSSR